jgi:hypothetical protein
MNDIHDHERWAHQDARDHDTHDHVDLDACDAAREAPEEVMARHVGWPPDRDYESASS